MIPVLSVRDHVAACRQLETLGLKTLGLVRHGPGLMGFGTARIAVIRQGQAPAAMIPLPLDHLAFQVADVDRHLRTAQAAGARLDPQFTPDGPREIAAFFAHGMRYVFLSGPEGAPVEFCTRLGDPAPQPDGHGHLGLRAADLDAAQAGLARLAPLPVARHILPAQPRPVQVRFLAAGDLLFELFDEPPRSALGSGAWVGLLPAAALADGSFPAGPPRV
ncbi:MAG: VOC family protein [Paracoccaceae bacterium]